MLTITNQDGKSFTKEVQNRWSHALAGKYDQLDGVTYFGSLCFWSKSGSGQTSITIPQSNSNYVATLMVGPQYNQSVSTSLNDSTNIVKAIGIQASQTQLNINIDNSWYIYGIFPS
jgi:hypothetical protein